MTRDRVQNALRRVHTDALHNTTIDVFEPAESFSQGDGWSVTYPDSASATYDARVESPTDDVERTVYGTVGEIDVDVRVRDDTGQQWKSFGDDTEAPARITDTGTGITYEVQAVVEQHDGLVRLGAVEV